MKRLLASAIVLASGITLSAQTLALGLGELTLQSALNQPLKAEIELVDSKGLTEFDIKPSLASQADFDRAGVERAYFLTKIQFKVENNHLVLSSTELVNEPFLNFLIELNWPTGRVLREYTVLLDPPVFEESTAQPFVNTATSAPFDEEQVQLAEPSTPVAVNHWDEPAAPGSYKVQPNDTLWAIALATRPERAVSPQQMMLALQAENPEAFIGGNINRLKSHYVLRVPDAERIKAISFNEAVAEVARQNQVLKAGTAQLDATGRASQPAPHKAETEGGEVRLLSDKSSAADTALATGDANGEGASRQVLENDLAIALENVDKSERENTELNSKLKALEEQVGTLQRLISLKDDQLANLQANKAAENNAAATTDFNYQALDTAASATAAAEPQEAEVSVPAAEDEAAEKAKQEAEAAEQAKKEAAEKARRARLEALMAAQEPAPEPSLLDDLLANPAIPAGVLAVILLAAVLVVRTLKKRKEAASLKEADAADLAVLNDIDSSAGSLDDFDFHEEELDAPLLDEASEPLPADADEQSEHFDTVQTPSDALSASDFCIAYGKFEQAVELLQAAIVQEPARTDLRLKLLEVYVEMDNAKGFATAETELRKLNDARANSQAEQLRQRLSAPIAAAAFTSVAAAKAEELPDLDLQLSSNLADDFAEGLDFSDALDNLDDLPAPAPAAQAEAAGDDALDFDLGDFNPEPTPSAAPQEQKPVEDDFLEFDLDSFDSAPVEDAPELAAAPAQADNLGALEFDLGDDLGSDSVELQSEANEEAAAMDSLESLLDSEEVGDQQLPDLDFDLSDSAEQVQMADEQLEEAPTDFDLDSIQSTDTQDLAPALETVTASSEGDIDLEQLAQAEDDFSMLSGTDESATKLDLARAYIDMDDLEGARELLQEVVQEGSPAQQSEAKGLLSNL